MSGGRKILVLRSQVGRKDWEDHRVYELDEEEQARRDLAWDLRVYGEGKTRLVRRTMIDEVIG